MRNRRGKDVGLAKEAGCAGAVKEAGNVGESKHGSGRATFYTRGDAN